MSTSRVIRGAGSLVLITALALAGTGTASTAATPNVAAPDNATAPIKARPTGFVLGAGLPPVSVKIRVPKATYTTICFDFQFAEDDPVDPDEEVHIDVAPPNTVGGVGFVNVGASPIVSRTLCAIDPGLVAVFNDGRQTIDLFMPIGSSTVTSFVIRPT